MPDNQIDDTREVLLIPIRKPKGKVRVHLGAQKVGDPKFKDRAIWLLEELGAYYSHRSGYCLSPQRAEVFLKLYRNGFSATRRIAVCDKSKPKFRLGGDLDMTLQQALKHCDLQEGSRDALDVRYKRLHVAKAFIDELKKKIGKRAYADVIRRQAKDPQHNFCYSHEYCDANMIMDSAMSLAGVDPTRLKDGTATTELLRVWNEAWILAKALMVVEHYEGADAKPKRLGS